MAISVRIPTPLRKLTNDADTVSGEGGTVAQVLADLNGQFPGLNERLYDETGALRRFVNIYLNDEDIRFLNGDATELKEGDELSIVPAIAGGC